MSKHLPAPHLRQTADFHNQRWFVELPDGHTFDDLFQPLYWAHHKRLNQYDLVRVRAQDGRFDVMLTVVTRAQGGVVMEVWPKMPDQASIERAVESKAEAVEPRTVNGKPVPRVDHTKATKWRLIGLDGQEHSSNYETRAAAVSAMTAYMASLGLQVTAEAA